MNRVNFRDEFSVMQSPNPNISWVFQRIDTVSLSIEEQIVARIEVPLWIIGDDEHQAMWDFLP